MKTLKVILIIIVVILLGVLAGGVYIKTALPNADPAPKLSIQATPERIENGRYLANHVAVCMDCHSTRNWERFAGPMVANGMGGGGEVFNQQMGFPGTFYAPNLTPYALAGWTDGEIFRAITAGVDRDGKALFPVMASHRFGKMDREDLYDIVAYVRSLTPVKKDIPESKADFPVSILINTMPQKPSFTKRPDTADELKYGAYLVNAAGCVDCHSQTEKGSIIAGTEFGGGMEFLQPVGVVRAPNITFDQQTGLGSWTPESFLTRFKLYADPAYRSPLVEKGSYNTPMPWTMYAGMKDSDLRAIYRYLKSLAPISNQVERFTPKK
jgi:hypothetical protein